MSVAFAVIVVTLLKQKSLFIDDAQHMPAGYSYLITRDFRLNQEHPPLVKLASGLGLSVVKPELPLDSPAWEKAAEPGDPDDGTSEFAEAFFERNANRFEAVAFWGRLPLVIFPLLMAAAAWWFARELFGEPAGVVAAALLLAEPNVIGNATLVQDDLAAALMLLVFVIALRHYFRRPGLLRAALLGITLGLALLVKHSLLVLVPACLAAMTAHAVFVYARRRETSRRRLELPIILTMLCAYLVFIAGYAFQVDWISEDDAAMVAGWLPLSGRLAESFQALLLHLPILLPKYFLAGLDLVLRDTRQGRPAFLFGEVSARGWWYYFPVALALKTAPPFLIASLGGLAWSIRRIINRRWRDGLYVVLPPLLYLALSMTSRLNIGVRHVLPVFPFFAIAGAGALASVTERAVWRRIRWRDLSVAAVLAWSLMLAALVYPNYLTYFGPLAGGTSGGWRRLSDSNVETGQEVKALAEYLKRRGVTSVAGLCIGGEFLRFYGVSYCPLPCGADEDDDAPSEPPPYAAIGAWYLQEVDVTPEQKAAIDQFRERQPEAMVGHSIFVYRIR